MTELLSPVKKKSILAICICLSFYLPLFCHANEPVSDTETPQLTEAQKRKQKKKEARERKQEQELAQQKQAQTEKKRIFFPDIYRCPECGYEQDIPGKCPDHPFSDLLKTFAKTQNPLEPTELDGNEDLIADIPLSNLTFYGPKPSSASDTASKPTKKL
ncbi:MAG: hypothetical protein GX221_10745 [Candidatus Riflebacteria bacterium]|nr:hypothetical protein [Candidatus Riflebacteria bacterium]